MAKIAIMGFGTVGSGVLEVLRKNAASVLKRGGEPVEVKCILDIRDFSTHPDAALFVKELDTILDDPEIKVVVETIGGIRPAYSFVTRCLEKGISVVTSNKEMVAMHGAQLMELAKKNNAAFLFEASVGGGIPIIRTLKDGLGSNHILALRAILNGTSNYILTQMFEHNKSFAQALQEAQNLGYAEADPTLDINGYDAGAKLLILASLAYGINAVPEDILIEGIEEITSDDMEFAKEFGYVIKLLGIAKRHKDTLELRVHPTLISQDSMIGKVSGVMNGISVLGDCVGESMYYGAGAGGEATASSVISDLIEIARDTHSSMLGFSESIQTSLTLKSRDTISASIRRISPGC